MCYVHNLEADLCKLRIQAHIETYTRNILGSFRDDPQFQFVQINMQENKLKWALLSLFLSSLRRSMPEEYRSTYLVSTQSLEYLKEVRPTSTEITLTT